MIGEFHEPSRYQIDVTAEYSRCICTAHCSGGETKNYVRVHYPGKYYEIRTRTRLTYLLCNVPSISS